jgi:hypothetical protein
MLYKLFAQAIRNVSPLMLFSCFSNCSYLEKGANVDRFRPTLSRWRYEVLKTSILLSVATSPRQEFVSYWLIASSQSHYAISISQSHNDSWEQSCSQRWNSGPHMWKQLHSLVQGSAIPFRRQIMTPLMSKDKIHVFRKLVTCPLWWHCPTSGHSNWM